ncbi:MAG: sigma 54-interacting transcriptional regulator, partial [Mailhella sp.]|nr:sigma 54-interacting transcriptional regulator [Mailhella sp.]
MVVNRLGRELQVIRELSDAMAHSRDVRVVLEHLLGALGRQMGMERAMVTLRYGDELVVEASDGLDEEEQKLGHYRLGEGIVGYVAETGRLHIVPDVRKDKRFLNRTRSRESSEAVAFICVPLFHQNEVIGTLSIDRKLDYSSGEDPDLEQDAAFLETVGNMAADAAFLLLREQEEQTALREENRQLRDLLDGPEGMIGQCREMLLVAEQIRQVAPSDATVLIRGASGTGKELVAKAIVKQSLRRDKPFISLNCAVLPDDLVESELFGHEKGAFTGAVSRRLGRAEEADGGTLFLDEIGDISPRVQVKLLRFLQERTFSRMGDCAAYAGVWSEENWPKEIDRYIVPEDEDASAGKLGAAARAARVAALEEYGAEIGTNWREAQDWLHGRRKGFAITYSLSEIATVRPIGGQEAFSRLDVRGNESYESFGRFLA